MWFQIQMVIEEVSRRREYFPHCNQADVVSPQQKTFVDNLSDWLFNNNEQNLRIFNILQNLNVNALMPSSSCRAVY